MSDLQRLWIKSGKLVDESFSSTSDYSWCDYDLQLTTHAEALSLVDNIPSFALKAMLSQESRPRVESFNEGMLIILRGINFNPDESEEDMVSIRIWVEKNRIVTCHYRSIQTLDEIKEKMTAGAVPMSSSVLLAHLISILFQKIEDTILELDDSVDLLEESITESTLGISQDVRGQITLLRKKIVVFKRHLLPQREVVSQLRNSTLNWLHDEHRNYHNENYERVMRNLEDLEVMRDKLNILKEDVQYILSDRLNKNTYILSIVAAIFLPLGFLTGLLGINVGGIPGTDNPNSFWLTCVGLVVIVAAQAILFRKMKWL
ncbi:zinc transporter ZntB [Leucothrix arctica]|uniref:Zinc transporter ZntB n=1 Tax=Leucothrix arctica TaxID=1481894 RepID=A0A317CPX0_9GAMM|nr:zinc transporter ZntB [Leucothrix arctica]PWQ98430.1 zinc transporter ZntB [Leucothrix arctica]